MSTKTNASILQQINRINAHHMNPAFIAEAYANFMRSKTQALNAISTAVSLIIADPSKVDEALAQLTSLRIGRKALIVAKNGEFVTLGSVIDAVQAAWTRAQSFGDDCDEVYAEIVSAEGIPGFLNTVETITDSMSSSLVGNDCYEIALRAIASGVTSPTEIVSTITTQIKDSFPRVTSVSPLIQRIKDVLFSSGSVEQKVAQLTSDVGDAIATQDPDDVQSFEYNVQSDITKMTGSSPAAAWVSDLTVDIDLTNVGSAIVSTGKKVLNGIKSFFTKTVPAAAEKVAEFVGNKFIDPALYLDGGVTAGSCFDIPMIDVTVNENTLAAIRTANYMPHQELITPLAYPEWDSMYNELCSYISQSSTSVIETDFFLARWWRAETATFKNWAFSVNPGSSDDMLYTLKPPQGSGWSDLISTKWSQVGNEFIMNYEDNSDISQYTCVVENSAALDIDRYLYSVAQHNSYNNINYDGKPQNRSVCFQFTLRWYPGIDYKNRHDDFIISFGAGYRQRDAGGYSSGYEYITYTKESYSSMVRLPRTEIFHYNASVNKMTLKTGAVYPDGRILNEYSDPSGPLYKYATFKVIHSIGSNVTSILAYDYVSKEWVFVAEGEVDRYDNGSDHRTLESYSQYYGVDYPARDISLVLQAGSVTTDEEWKPSGYAVTNFCSYPDTYGLGVTVSEEVADSIVATTGDWRAQYGTRNVLVPPAIDMRFQLFVKPTYPKDDAHVNWATLDGFTGNLAGQRYSYPSPHWQYSDNASVCTLEFSHSEVRTLDEYFNWVFPDDEILDVDFDNETQINVGIAYSLKRALNYLWLLAHVHEEVPFAEVFSYNTADGGSGIEDRIQRLLNVCGCYSNTSDSHNLAAMWPILTAGGGKPANNVAVMNSVNFSLSDRRTNVSGDMGSWPYSQMYAMAYLVTGVFLWAGLQHVETMTRLYAAGMEPVFIPYLERTTVPSIRFKVASDEDSKKKMTALVTVIAVAAVVIAATVVCGVLAVKLSNTALQLTAKAQKNRADLAVATDPKEIARLTKEGKKIAKKQKLISKITGKSVKPTNPFEPEPAESTDDIMLNYLSDVDRKIGLET